MGIIVKERASKQHFCTLPVECQGMNVIVRAGAFKFGGEEFSLAQDEEITVEPDSVHEKNMLGYLVEEIATGNPMLLIDDPLENGIDRTYKFGRNSPYKCMYRLFFFKVAAGLESLDDVEIMVFHLLEETEETEEGQ